MSNSKNPNSVPWGLKNSQRSNVGEKIQEADKGQLTGVITWNSRKLALWD